MVMTSRPYARGKQCSSGRVHVRVREIRRTERGPGMAGSADVLCLQAALGFSLYRSSGKKREGPKRSVRKCGGHTTPVDSDDRGQLVSCMLVQALLFSIQGWSISPAPWPLLAVLALTAG